MCHEKNKILHSAGKSYEMAGSIFQTSKNIQSAIKWYREASRVYLDDGKNDRAAEVLSKAAKALEKEDPENTQLCKELYEEAIEASSLNGKYHNSTDLIRSFNTFLVKNRMYADAIKNCETLRTAYQSLSQVANERKTMLSMIILHLKMDDQVAAEDLLNKFTNEIGSQAQFSQCDEGDLAIQFLSAFQNRDEQLLANTRQNSLLKYLEGPFAKIAMNLTLNPLFEDSKLSASNKKTTTAKKTTGSNTSGTYTTLANSNKSNATKKASLFAVEGEDEEDQDPKKKRSVTSNAFLSGSSSSSNKPKSAFAPMPSKEEMEQLKKRQQEAYDERQRRKLEEPVDEDDEDNDHDDDDGLDLTGAPAGESSSQSSPQTKQPSQPKQQTTTETEEDDDITHVSYVPSTQAKNEDVDDYFTSDVQKPPVAANAPAYEEEEESNDIFDPTDLT